MTGEMSLRSESNGLEYLLSLSVLVPFMMVLEKTDKASTEKAFTESSDTHRKHYMHPVFSIANFLTSLMKVGSVQKISNVLFRNILFLHIFIPCVGATSGSATIIPTPTLNVTSLTYSSCYVPSSSCPLSDDDRDKHLACLFDFDYQATCPPGWTYFCDDKSSDYLVEGCLERHTCLKGTVNYIYFDPSSRTTTMGCKNCQEHFIQRKEHDSAVDYITGCDTKGVSLHILQNLDKMVIVYNGGTTDYSQYVCDTSKGYSENHGITLCNVSNDCICDQSVSCDNPEFPVLLPNGTCDKQCTIDRDSLFECKLYEKQINSTDHLVQKYTTDAGGNTAGSTEQTTTGLSHPILAVILGLSFALIVCIVVSVYCFRRKRKLSMCHRDEETARKELVELLEPKRTTDDSREGQTTNTNITNKYYVDGNLINIKDVANVELNIPGNKKEVNEDVASESDEPIMTEFVTPPTVSDEVENLSHGTDVPRFCDINIYDIEIKD